MLYLLRVALEYLEGLAKCLDDLLQSSTTLSDVFWFTKAIQDRFVFINLLVKFNLKFLL